MWEDVRERNILISFVPKENLHMDDESQKKYTWTFCYSAITFEIHREGAFLTCSRIPPIKTKYFIYL